MDWTSNQEAYLTKLHVEAYTLEEFNRKQVNLFSRIQQRFSIPILALSALNSLAAVCLQGLLKQEHISVINASLRLFVGILGSVQLFLRVESRVHTHTICCHEFGKLAHKISRELSVEREVRASKGRDFLAETFAEFISILDKCEPATKKLRNHLLLTPCEESIEGSIDTIP